MPSWLIAAVIILAVGGAEQVRNPLRVRGGGRVWREYLEERRHGSILVCRNCEAPLARVSDVVSRAFQVLVSTTTWLDSPPSRSLPHPPSLPPPSSCTT
eukprot:736752-Hanusia_phi.AAC.1